jgi:hypothetical protein
VKIGGGGDGQMAGAKEEAVSNKSLICGGFAFPWDVDVGLLVDYWTWLGIMETLRG